MTDELDLRGQVCGGPRPSNELDGFAARLAEWNCMSQETRGALCASNAPRAAPSPAADLASEWIKRASSRSTELSRSIRTNERELARQRAELADVRQRERRSAIAAVVEVMRRLGITVDELRNGIGGTLVELPQMAAAVASPPPVRLVGPQGQVWLGQGRRPNWLKQFLAAGGHLSDLRQPKAQELETA